MQRTPRDAGSRWQQKTSPVVRRRSNAAIAGLSLAVLATGALITMQWQGAEAANGEAAGEYTPAVTYTAPPKPTTVAFLGDSYTQGAGTSTKFNRWSTLLSNENRWLELNYGYGGTNFATAGQMAGGKAYTNRLTDLTLSRPDIVIVSSAGNDLQLNQEKGITSTFEELREELPDAEIIALSPFRWAGDYPEDLEDFGEEVKDGVEAVGGKYVDVGHPLEKRRDAIAADGKHPNDLGHELLAEAVGEALD